MEICFRPEKRDTLSGIIAFHGIEAENCTRNSLSSFNFLWEKESILYQSCKSCKHSNESTISRVCWLLKYVVGLGIRMKWVYHNYCLTYLSYGKDCFA